MNNREALQALLDGKKVRQPAWADKDYHIEMTDAGDIVNAVGTQMQHHFSPSATWEIYQPKPRLLTLEELKGGLKGIKEIALYKPGVTTPISYGGDGSCFMSEYAALHTALSLGWQVEIVETEDGE